jgi:hypothetical protein
MIKLIEMPYGDSTVIIAMDVQKKLLGKRMLSSLPAKELGQND